MKNTSIAISAKLESFIDETVKSGRYNDANEVIQAGLRILQEQEKKRELLLQALEEGEQSGMIKNFKMEDLLLELNSKKC